MNSGEAALLGLIQGLTEFLPVSSSGHLVLGEALLGLEQSGLAFEVWLHLATLVAVTAALWKDLWSMAAWVLPGTGPEAAGRGRTLLLSVMVGTLPAVAVGLFAKDAVESAFDSVRVVGIDLLITAGILFISRFFPGRGRPITLGRGFLIGMAQALAILPGISRSGSTLTAGLALGLGGVDAARFSFLLAFPAILGAAVLEFDALMALGETAALPLVLGFLTAGASGYAAIRIVWRVMERGKLAWFAPYCALVGIATLLLVK